MRVSIRKVEKPEQEQVVLECISLTQDFKDVQEYALSKGDKIVAYGKDREMCMILQDSILYVEAVGELVFAYTGDAVYEVKTRLYEMEQLLRVKKFLRCSKSSILNVRKVLSIKPALNGRFLAKMENGEEVMISRQYARGVRKYIMEEL